MLYEMDETDVLFGDDCKELPDDELTLLFSTKIMALSLKEKLKLQDKFRRASPSQKLKMLDRFLGPMPEKMRPFLPPHLGGTNSNSE